jgi:tRNA (guanine26-N2/guanine27-N2)-dimethyltransferase
VFYNPDMALDRDLAVAFTSAYFGPGDRRGWDMLSATGARGLRILAESGAFASFLCSEANPEAAGVLQENARGIVGAIVRRADARALPVEAPFDYVDIDPYGSPVEFVPTALRALRPGGVLAVTATDLMVLSGVQPGACERLYGSHPVRGRLGPEGGLRILLALLVRAARQQERTIRPLMAYVRGHHLRAYLEVSASGAPPDRALVGMIDTGPWTGPYLGDHGPYGPMWLGPLFDPELARRLTTPSTAALPVETERFLTRIREEATVDRPFYFEANELAGALGLPFPASAAELARGLRAGGYQFARTHMRPEGFRTDAPRAVVERIVTALSAASPSRGARPPAPDG